MNPINLDEELLKKLERLAFERSHPFCYQCYKRVNGTHCPTCGSDDNMRELEGVGVEYGTDWIISHILNTELSPINLDESFESMMEECYGGTTKIGWLEYDTVSAIKELDPVSYRMAKSEHADSLLEDQACSFDGGETLYTLQDLEDLVSHISLDLELIECAS